MKLKKLRELLASISDVPLGCYRMVDNVTGWHDLPTKDADAIRNAIAEKIRRKERKKARKGVPHYDWVSTPDVCIGVNGYVDSVGAFNLAQATEEIRELDQGRAAVKTELDAVVALQECAAHIGMNASVESIPFILDNLPRIVKDLVASSRWPTRAGGWEDCSGLDAELTRSVPNGGEPRHFRRLRPECSPVIDTLASGEQAVTWGNGSDSYRVVTGSVKAVQKLAANGLWLLATEVEPEELSLADRLESVAAGMRRGAVVQDIVDLFEGVEALRTRKAVQS